MDRDDSLSADPSHSSFQALNEGGAPASSYMRDRLESWFRRFPPAGQRDLRARFRSNDDHVHEGAFFELFLHELFTRLGFKLSVHPEVAGAATRPDFLVRRRGQRFYLEATVVGKKQGNLTYSPNEQDVIDKLNELASPSFYISVHTEGTLTKTLGKKEVTRPFEELLDAHDPDEVQRLIDEGGSNAAPSRRIQHGTWSLAGWLYPVSPENRGNAPRQLVIGRHRALRIDPVFPVQKAVKKKAQAYGPLDAPLVVAVSPRDVSYDAPRCDLEVLFGKERLAFSEGQPTQLDRQPDGIWSTRSKIDAVMMFQRVDIWNLSNASACLYVSPQHAVSLPKRVFRLPHARCHDGKMAWCNGEDIVQLVMAPNGGGLKAVLLRAWSCLRSRDQVDQSRSRRHLS